MTSWPRLGRKSGPSWRDEMGDLVVVFRTHSDIEANVVRSLLEYHGIESVLASDIPHSIFPLSVDGLGEVRISVKDIHADEARRIIESHGESHRKESGGHIRRLQDEFQDLEATIGYQFRDQGLIEHALTHRSRAHEDISGGVIDNESLEFLGDAVLGVRHRRRVVPRVPRLRRGTQIKVEGTVGLGASLGAARQAVVHR